MSEIKLARYRFLYQSSARRYFFFLIQKLKKEKKLLFENLDLQRRWNFGR